MPADITRRPDATQADLRGRIWPTPSEGPFLRTGDLGFLRDGQLFVTGRLKDVIIIRGRNYYPEDIEHSVEAAHDAFRAGYLRCLFDRRRRPRRLVVVQEIEPRRRDLDADAALQAIRRADRRRTRIGSLCDRAGQGRPDSQDLQRQDAAVGMPRAISERPIEGLGPVEGQYETPRRGAAAPQGAPHSEIVTAAEIENWLIQRIAARLRLSPAEVRVTTPFLDFGMGSIDAVEIAAELERWLGRRMSPTAIYNYPNIAALAGGWPIRPLRRADRPIPAGKIHGLAWMTSDCSTTSAT